MKITAQTRSLAEAATALGVATRTLRRYVAEGRVGAVRLYGTRGPLRFTDQDIADARSALVIRLDRTA